MRVAFHPEAKQEFLEAMAYYARRADGLGLRLEMAVEEAVAQIRIDPERFPKLRFDVRRSLVHIFPYGLLFSLHGNVILIIAVMHLSRRPNYWLRRRIS